MAVSSAGDVDSLKGVPVEGEFFEESDLESVLEPSLLVLEEALPGLLDLELDVP